MAGVIYELCYDYGYTLHSALSEIVSLVCFVLQAKKRTYKTKHRACFQIEHISQEWNLWSKFELITADSIVVKAFSCLIAISQKTINQKQLFPPFVTRREYCFILYKITKAKSSQTQKNITLQHGRVP